MRDHGDDIIAVTREELADMRRAERERCLHMLVDVCRSFGTEMGSGAEQCAGLVIERCIIAIRALKDD